MGSEKSIKEMINDIQKLEKPVEKVQASDFCLYDFIDRLTCAFIVNDVQYSYILDCISQSSLVVPLCSTSCNNDVKSTMEAFECIKAGIPK